MPRCRKTAATLPAATAEKKTLPAAATRTARQLPAIAAFGGGADARSGGATRATRTALRAEHTSTRLYRLRVPRCRVLQATTARTALICFAALLRCRCCRTAACYAGSCRAAAATSPAGGKGGRGLFVPCMWEGRADVTTWTVRRATAAANCGACALVAAAARRFSRPRSLACLLPFVLLSIPAFGSRLHHAEGRSLLAFFSGSYSSLTRRLKGGMRALLLRCGRRHALRCCFCSGATHHCLHLFAISPLLRWHARCTLHCDVAARNAARCCHRLPPAPPTTPAAAACNRNGWRVRWEGGAGRAGRALPGATVETAPSTPPLRGVKMCR